MSYAATATKAYRKIGAAGAPVTFSFLTPGTENPATGVITGRTTTTVSGVAMQVKGKGLLYQQLSLIESEAPTLLFSGSPFGALPTLGATVVWNGITYTVRDINETAPDGNAIFARVVIAR